ncbi:patched domain-containing protein 3-like [Mytilus californianus]|uniref:patched domain-containing protein 3-like n=1 Tax=Mytilus californianus TaxID=6549 RepID=UPI0022451AA7|nr:patched domain-containing protein 3-like [Mytilus californianus]
MNCCYLRAGRRIGNLYSIYGKVISRNPIPTIILSVFLNALLGINIKWMQVFDDYDTSYLPRHSEANMDAQKVKSFLTNSDFDDMFCHQLNGDEIYGSVVFSVDDNIIAKSFKNEISKFHKTAMNIQVKSSDMKIHTIEDFCVKNNGKCFILGSWYLEDYFWDHFEANNITYPYFKDQKGIIHMSYQQFGKVTVRNGVLKSAGSLRMTYYLKQDTSVNKDLSVQWSKQFVHDLLQLKNNTIKFIVSNSETMATDIGRNTVWDPQFFVVVFLAMAMYSFLATVSGNCLTQRGLLGIAGVLSTVISILGASGFCAVIGVEYVNIGSIMPFIILGIGLYNLFVLLSGLNRAPVKGAVEERIGSAMRDTGVSITISSLTDITALLIGALMTDLTVIRNFCFFTGSAVFLCFFNQMTFVLACAVLHERRVAGSMHCITCQTVYTAEQMKTAHYRNKLTIVCCSGHEPEKSDDLQSYVEMLPARTLPKCLLNIPVKVIILFLYLGYITFSIWSTTNLGVGSQFTDVLRQDSISYQFNNIEKENFGMTTIVSFNIQGHLDYSRSDVHLKVDDMLQSAKKNTFFDKKFEINWLKEFNDSYLNENITEIEFIEKLHLFVKNNPMFKNDIVFDSNKTHVLFSRFYVMTNDIKSPRDQKLLLEESRIIARNSSLNVLPFSTQFVYFEQNESVLSKAILQIGFTFAACTLVSFILILDPILIVFLVLTVASIIVGVFSLMSIWNLNLNLFTIVYVIICTGFSFNFVAYFCKSFIHSQRFDRQGKVNDAIIQTSGTIINSAISTVISIVILLFSRSEIFTSFFKIVLFVILLSVFHTIFVLPVILSVTGPIHDNMEMKSNQRTSSRTPLFPSRSAATWSITSGGVNALDNNFKRLKLVSEEKVH